MAFERRTNVDLRQRGRPVTLIWAFGWGWYFKRMDTEDASGRHQTHWIES